MMKNLQRGITLIEIMVVTAIMAIMAALAIPAFKAIREASQKKAQEKELRQIESRKQNLPDEQVVQLSPRILAPEGSSAYSTLTLVFNKLSLADRATIIRRGYSLSPITDINSTTALCVSPSLISINVTKTSDIATVEKLAAKLSPLLKMSVEMVDHFDATGRTDYHTYTEKISDIPPQAPAQQPAPRKKWDTAPVQVP